MLHNACFGDMGHSEYDAAWIARVPLPGTTRPAFPEVLRVVDETQRPDGSWGSEIDYASARITSTLASVLALLEFDRSPSVWARAEAGAAYVRRTWPRLREAPLTIGFELIAGALLDEACQAGLGLGELRQEAAALRAQKLARVPRAKLYDPRLSVSFSLEFLGDDLDLEQARRLQLPNGALGATPAPTAYYARKTGDPAAYTYLRNVVETFGPANIPYGMPATLWIRTWMLHHLQHGGLLNDLEDAARPHLEFIHQHLGPQGMSWSEALTYGDSDNTAVAVTLMHDYGFPVDWAWLQQYEHDQGFICFPAENGPSTSACAHVLLAICGRPYPNNVMAAGKAAKFLLDHRVDGAYWVDKWHSSPFYVTSHAIRALLLWNPLVAEPSIGWLLRTQRPDGSWGHFGCGTAEETAYSLHALAAFHDAGGYVDPLVFQRAMAFLEPFDGSEPPSAHPRLWIAKTLYRPLYVIRSAVLAAQALSHRILEQCGVEPSLALAFV